MNRAEFLREMADLPGAYRWHLEGNYLRAQHPDAPDLFCPITAVVNHAHGELWGMGEATIASEEVLGMDDSTAFSIIDSADLTMDGGDYDPILRAEMLQAAGLATEARGV